MQNKVSRIAFEDISKHLKTNTHNPRSFMDENCDVWIVTPKMLNTPETRKLNRELNLHCVNKQWRNS